MIIFLNSIYLSDCYDNEAKMLPFFKKEYLYMLPPYKPDFLI